ncbi:MAG TPA: DUF2156 domain-containing protein [Clostridiales bacterium]|jgi:hypothetical protein|nr:DUF2156 domain-containing protein [Clostridiales bacterium]
MSIEFTKLTDENVALLPKYMSCQRFKTSDYTTGSTYMWREFFGVEFAIIEDMLVIRTEMLDNGECFSYPIGFNDEKKVLDILGEGRDSLRLCNVPREALEKLKGYYGEERLTYRDAREWADYLYDVEQFCTFSGKKLHAKRNFLNRFRSTCNLFDFIPLTKHTSALALEFLEYYYSEEKDISAPELSPTEKEDAIRAMEAIEKLHLLPTLSGGILVCEKRTIGVTAGEIIDDVLYVHIEKATTTRPGVYQALSSEYAKFAKRQGVKYINRADDSGDMGLRKSKLSYYPIDILPKYYVDVKLG